MVVDEGAFGDDEAEAGATHAGAVVVVFEVADGEALVEGPGLGEGLLADGEAEADEAVDGHDAGLVLAWRCGAKVSMASCESSAGPRICWGPAAQLVTGPAMPMSITFGEEGGEEFVEPSGREEGVAVEEDDMPPCVLEAEVHAAGEAEIDGAVEDGGAGDGIEEGGHAVGGAVVDEDEVVGFGVCSLREATHASQ